MFKPKFILASLVGVFIGWLSIWVIKSLARGDAVPVSDYVRENWHGVIIAFTMSWCVHLLRRGHWSGA